MIYIRNTDLEVSLFWLKINVDSWESVLEELAMEQFCLLFWGIGSGQGHGSRYYEFPGSPKLVS